MRQSSGTIFYTGAGISTAASIPDYRGPNGVWTLAEQGETSTALESCDPTQAYPTLSHMALRCLYEKGLLRHVLSQNCDGLHLRSGLPQSALSEVHGNMYVEVCTNCQPLRQYIRSFDVTEKTNFRRHRTSRRCERCNGVLRDTIVHFGECGRLNWPLNWAGIDRALNSEPCDLIVCLGSSLTILKKYEHLWPRSLSSPPSASIPRSPRLVIVNLQWTPKDAVADIKIHGRCDYVLNRLMENLNLTVPLYCKLCDPVLSQKRRSARNREIMRQITSCSCSANQKEAALSNNDNAERKNGAPPDSVTRTLPGWWTAGLKTSTKHKSTSSNGKAKYYLGGRKRRRKRSSIAGGLGRSGSHSSADDTSSTTGSCVTSVSSSVTSSSIYSSLTRASSLNDGVDPTNCSDSEDDDLPLSRFLPRPSAAKILKPPDTLVSSGSTDSVSSLFGTAEVVQQPPNGFCVEALVDLKEPSSPKAKSHLDDDRFKNDITVDLLQTSAVKYDMEFTERTIDLVERADTSVAVTKIET